MSQPILQLALVSKAFGGVQALRDVSFDLYPGEVHALVVSHGVNSAVRACRIISVTTDLTLVVAGRVYTCGREVLTAGLPVAADVGR